VQQGIAYEMLPDTSSVVKEIASRLMRDGCVTTMTSTGRRLFLISSRTLKMDEPGILVSLEKGGCHFWDGKEQINQFKLISSGFDTETSAILAGVLHAVNEEIGHAGR
jgi:hypothetical protein